MQLIATGLAFGESPRWHGGHLWVADWGTREIVRIHQSQGRETVLALPQGPFQPISIDWSPDGSLLVVASLERRLLRAEADGSLATFADLTHAAVYDDLVEATVVTGILEIAAAIRLRRELSHEWLLALTGALSVTFGVLALAMPGAGALSIVWLIGSYAILFGLLLLTLAFRIKGLVPRSPIAALKS